LKEVDSWGKKWQEKTLFLKDKLPEDIVKVLLGVMKMITA